MVDTEMEMPVPEYNTCDLQDEDKLYEMIKDYIRNDGDVNKCYTTVEFGNTVEQSYIYLMKMLIMFPDTVAKARYYAIKDAK